MRQNRRIRNRTKRHIAQRRFNGRHTLFQQDIARHLQRTGFQREFTAVGHIAPINILGNFGQARNIRNKHTAVDDGRVLAVTTIDGQTVTIDVHCPRRIFVRDCACNRNVLCRHSNRTCGLVFQTARGVGIGQRQIATRRYVQRTRRILNCARCNIATRCNLASAVRILVCELLHSNRISCIQIDVSICPRGIYINRTGIDGICNDAQSVVCIYRTRRK